MVQQVKRIHVSTVTCAVILCVGCDDSPLITSVDVETYAPSAVPCAVLMTFASSADTRGFAWQTDASVREGDVWILKEAHCVTNAVLFEREGTRFGGEYTIADDPCLICHKAYVQGLEPGDYSYRLGGSGHYAYGTFKIKGDDDVVVAVNLNDAQTQDATNVFVGEDGCLRGRSDR